ncbi:MAG TPA: heavy metal-responsive transcriptional regulator [Pirellulales bacterium]|nr:heavy metal-responsive transcriptional regulator [Pirellulales bacterium]
MSGRYTISQLARAAAVPVTTVRYYERVGLVRPEDRSLGNYRLYGDESLRTLKFIRSAQSIGFTLDDVKALLSAPQSGAASCRQVQSLIEERLADVDRRLKDLRHVRTVLKTALGKCRKSEAQGRCVVIESLRQPE